MMKLQLTALLVVLLVAAGFAVSPPQRCGPLLRYSCSWGKPCGPGYQCINKRCVCVNTWPSCPAGWVSGGPCYGYQKCGPKYQCINGQCCRKIFYG